MNLKFSDYDGPTGLYVATGDRILPLTSPEGAKAFAASIAFWGLQVGVRHVSADAANGLLERS